MLGATHNHRSGRIIRQQVSYAKSPAALESARNLISIKIINSRYLVGSYLAGRKRDGHNQVEILTATSNRLDNLASRCAVAPDRPSIFQIEAQAARVYWRSFALLSHQTPVWKRTHPHATDSLNTLLNIGYVLLARKCLESLIATELLPEIGLLHSDNSVDPLVYDLMEIFRQTAVDSVILPIFSRRKSSKVTKDDPAFRKTLALLNKRHQTYFWYKDRCEKLENIIKFEAIKLRQSITKNEPWQPYHHQWGRHHPCR